MCKINFSPFPNIETENLYLRQLNSKDENEFYILKSDERILKYLNYGPKTFDEARRFIEKLNDGISKNQWIIWGITLKGEDRIIGTICLWNISKEDSKAEVGYELMPDHHSRGIMNEALKAVIKYGFETMELNTITAVPNKNNIKSRKLLERNNFIEDGLIIEDHYCGGETFEMVMYKLNSEF